MRSLSWILGAMATDGVVLLLLNGHEGEDALYIVLALAHGLAFGAVTNRAPTSIGYVPLINEVRHQAAYFAGWAIYWYGGLWTSLGAMQMHGDNLRIAPWLAGVLMGILMGGGQPLIGDPARKGNFEQLRKSVRVTTVARLMLYTISILSTWPTWLTETHHTPWDGYCSHEYTLGIHAVLMLLAAIASLTHSWFAIPHVGLRATRIQQGVFRTNADPDLDR